MTEVQKTWNQQGNDYFLGEHRKKIPLLNNGIYILKEVAGSGECYLSRTGDKFEFDYKIYGLEVGLIEKVKKAFVTFPGNLGVLLNGIKGTGKTVTAEILANDLNMPIVLINSAYNGINAFLAQIEQPLTIFIDEYEKVYGGSDYDMLRESMNRNEDDEEEGSKSGNSALLSLMSGTFETPHKKVFLLTTNNKSVNENMINRPGRIRYVKNFDDLSLAQINEVIDDCLINKKHKKSILEFLTPMRILTIDIVKAVISEVNMEDKPANIACELLNIVYKKDSYDLVKLPKGKEKNEVTLEYGIEPKVIEPFLKQLSGKRALSAYLRTDDNHYQVTKGLNPVNDCFTVHDNDSYPVKNFDVRLKRVRHTHKSFK